jgi:hypothetical protein
MFEVDATSKTIVVGVDKNTFLVIIIKRNHESGFIGSTG